MEEAYITKGFNNWKKAFEAFVDHQQSKAHTAAITYESVVPQCGVVLEMTVNDLNNKRLVERKYLVKVMECIRFLARQAFCYYMDSQWKCVEKDREQLSPTYETLGCVISCW